jgi:cytosine/creatinine deaminase
MNRLINGTATITDEVLNLIAHLPTASLLAIVEKEFFRKLKDEVFMRIAVLLAQKSYDEGGCPIGAVVKDNETGLIVGKGHNTLVQDDNPYNHGETAAMEDAGRIDYSRTTLYTSLNPCNVCTVLVSERQVGRVVIGDITNTTNSADKLREGGIFVDILEDQFGIELYAKYMQERPDLHYEDWKGRAGVPLEHRPKAGNLARGRVRLGRPHR